MMRTTRTTRIRLGVDDRDENTGDRLSPARRDWGSWCIGAGLYHLLGGKSESLDGYEVHMDFNEPASEEIPE